MNLDEVIAALYESVSFEPGTRPDWSTHAEFFAPAARMVRVTDDGVFEFEIDSFRKNFEEMIDSGKLPSFWEGELWRETRLFGEMAHVLSAYETRRDRKSTPNEPPPTRPRPTESKVFASF